MPAAPFQFIVNPDNGIFHSPTCRHAAEGAKYASLSEIARWVRKRGGHGCSKCAPAVLARMRCSSCARTVWSDSRFIQPHRCPHCATGTLTWTGTLINDPSVMPARR